MAREKTTQDKNAALADPLSMPCWPGATVACIASGGACQNGKRFCGPDETWGACVPTQPTAEICADGVDNDCNGMVDDSCPTGTGGGSGGSQSVGGSGGSQSVGGSGGGSISAGGSSGAGGSTTLGCTPGLPLACVAACGTAGTALCLENGTPGPCIPPQELCADGVDNDCDGAIDEDCGQTYDCHATSGYGNCNALGGDGTECDAEDNVYGCEWSWFMAWCNRSVDYAGWDQAVRNWVADRCDGAVASSGNTYLCKDSSGDTYVCETPLVLVFGDEPVRFVSSRAPFDIAAQSRSSLSDWPSPRTPWLVLDRNANGAIDDGSELFGSATRLRSGERARNGFEALAELDDDGDQRLSPRDSAWQKLRLWSDTNGDRSSQPSELVGLDARGVNQIDLRWSSSPRCDVRGNCELERSTFTFDGSRTGAVVDVHLPLRSAP